MTAESVIPFPELWTRLTPTEQLDLVKGSTTRELLVSLILRDGPIRFTAEEIRHGLGKQVQVRFVRENEWEVSVISPVLSAGKAE